MKKIFFLILTIFIIGQNFAQRKTTSVKGYYRKDGTYVSPHTRHYNSSTSPYPSSSSSYSTNYKKEKNDSIYLTSLNVLTIYKSDYSIPKSKYGKDIKISPSKLAINSDENNTSKDTLNINSVSNIEGIVIYVSVLRYKGNTIDICPIARNYEGDWDFHNVKHHFNKNILSAEEVSQLVSHYDWMTSGKEIKKDFSTEHIISKGFPAFLTKTIEAIKLK
jgi:hypothetical protein